MVNYRHLDDQGNVQGTSGDDANQNNYSYNKQCDHYQRTGGEGPPILQSAIAFQQKFTKKN